MKITKTNPLTNRPYQILFLMFLPDSIAIIIASWAAYLIRFGLEENNSSKITFFYGTNYQVFLFFLGVGWIFSMAFSGIYRNLHTTLTVLSLPVILRPSINFFLLIGFASFVSKASISRLAYVAFFSIGLLLIFMFRVVVYFAVIKPLIKKRVISTRVLLIGLSKNDLARYSEWLMSNRKLGFLIVGKLECRNIDYNWISDFDIRLEGSGAKEVLLLPGMDSKENFSKFIHYLEDLQIHVNWIPHESGNIGYWQVPSSQLGLPFLTFEMSELSIIEKFSKRMFDVIFASIAIVAISPLLVIISVLILFTDGRPVLYSQQRVGRGGKKFKFFKFRSMVNNADTLLENIENNLGDKHVLFKNKKDPRVTRIGAILRKYSLDELPQFFNVLNNTMSVVGPRPALPREVSIYDSIYERRLIAKPGITGPWQISGRSDLDLQTSVALDLNYLSSWSMSKDIGIILGTLSAVIRGKGAY